jgi:hypothetical protein
LSRRVPEAPGLGVELDMEQLERLKRAEPGPRKKFIIKTRFANGTMLYTRPDPDNPHFMVRPDWSRVLMPLSYAAPLSSEYWDDDGTASFREMLARIEADGAVVTA